MAELTTLEGNFIISKEPIIDAFIGGQNVVAIYLGKTLVWTKEISLLEVALFDEIDRTFITEDETNDIFVDRSWEDLDLNLQFVDDKNNNYNTEDELLLYLDNLGGNDSILQENEFGLFTTENTNDRIKFDFINYIN